MSNKIGIYLPDDRMEDFEKHRKHINYSKLFWEAFDRKVLALENEKRPPGPPIPFEKNSQAWEIETDHYSDDQTIIVDDDAGMECYARVVGTDSARHAKMLAAAPGLFWTAVAAHRAISMAMNDVENFSAVQEETWLALEEALRDLKLIMEVAKGREEADRIERIWGGGSVAW